MKFLLTLTLTSVLAIGFAGCNKTAKVNASTTAAQCDGAGCDFANCGNGTVCAKAAKNCPLAGTAECPLAAATDSGASDADKRARRARYQEASDKMAAMVKAGEITSEQMQKRLDGMQNRMRKAADAKPAAVGATKSCCSSKTKAKPAAAGDAKNCCANKAKVKDGNGCPFSGSK